MSIEDEKRALGLMLFGCFDDPRNQAIYDAMIELFEIGGPVDLITLRAYLGELVGKDGLDDDYLNSLTDGIA
jgi:replicative DNA helicase